MDTEVAVAEREKVEIPAVPLHIMVDILDHQLSTMQDGMRAHDPDRIVLEQSSQRLQDFGRLWREKTQAYYREHPALLPPSKSISKHLQAFKRQQDEIGRAVIAKNLAAYKHRLPCKTKEDGKDYPEFILLDWVSEERETIVPSDDLKLAVVQNTLGVFSLLGLPVQKSWPEAMATLQQHLDGNRPVMQGELHPHQDGNTDRTRRLENLPTALEGLRIDINMNSGRIYGFIEPAVLSPLEIRPPSPVAFPLQ